MTLEADRDTRIGPLDPLILRGLRDHVQEALREAIISGRFRSGDKLNAVLENIKVEMGSLMGGPIQFAPKDHYGTTWWRVYQYEANGKKFQPVSDWQEASSTPTLRKQ